MSDLDDINVAESTAKWLRLSVPSPDKLEHLHLLENSQTTTDLFKNLHYF